MMHALAIGETPERVAFLLRLRAAREAEQLNTHVAALLIDAATLIEAAMRNGGLAR